MDFMPRGECGPWSENLKTLYIYGNLMIFLAYMAIPFALYVSLRGRARRARRVQYRITYGFMAFILMCGGGHLLDGVGSFWWPNYHFFAFWHLGTGAVSWYVAILLPRVIRQELQELDHENE